MKCLNCNKEFTSERKTAKYCSSLCRKQFQRKIAGQESPKISGTHDLSVEVPNNNIPNGYCFYCGLKFSDYDCYINPSLEVCFDCVARKYPRNVSRGNYPSHKNV